MSLSDNIRSFFGLTPPVHLSGFRAQAETHRSPACGRCGAVVAYESQQLHAHWHAREGH